MDRKYVLTLSPLVRYAIFVQQSTKGTPKCQF